MSLKAGGTFSADLQASDTSVKIKVAFHYRVPAGKGKPNVDCSQGSFPALRVWCLEECEQGLHPLVPSG